jgi:hypothetical protein
MVMNSKIKQKRGWGKCGSPVLLHEKMSTCRAGRPREITLQTEGKGKEGEDFREEGDDNSEQFSNTGTERCDIVCQYITKVKRGRRRSV